ncbi:MAG TPA: protein kinase [Kofleriaceae bacterium]|nr:protein kinase [Kofleriaceae bacterium]
MRVGDVIAGRFALEALARAGGMGAVYRARDNTSDVPVAIKLLRAPGPTHEERFMREAALLSELRHRSIVRHLCHGRTPSGELYLAMEWLEGEDLATRLGRGRLTIGESLILIRQVLEGLLLLHDRGGVHRDLKPSNLFLVGGSVNEVRILDFGVARAIAGMKVTQTGLLVGTPGYAAPEQIRGTADVDGRADLFAVACVLYECIAGQPAFSGEHLMSVLARVLLDEARRLSDVVRGVPPALDEVLAWTLSKDPAQRPAHARELLSQLDQIAVDATARPMTPRPPTLGSDEQRFMSLVIANDVEHAGAAHVGGLETVAPGEDAASGAAPTLAPDVGSLAQRLAALMRQHGGQLERLADDAWVVVPPAAVATAPATDQAALAARCALAFKAALPRARVVIASGRGVHAGHMPVGEVIDGALALLEGDPSDIVVDPLTAGLLGGRFEVRETATELVLHRERHELESDRRVLGQQVPCVGRDRELATLLALFDECAGEPTARAVLLRAPPGYGKSRLARELHSRLRARGSRFQWLYGRGDPIRAGAPFALAAQLIRRAAGIVEGEPLEQRREKLQQWLAVVPAEERWRVATFLGQVIDTPSELAHPQLATAQADAAVMGDQIRRAWDDWLTAAATQQPLVLVLDDLHLGDLPTVRLIDSALRNLRELPVMILALARPEIHAIFPNLWSTRPVTELPLPELSRKASTRLVREVLGARATDAVVDRLVSRAGGNAYYLEELCRVAVEGADQALPHTVLAMAQARLATLGSDARRVLRAAAVFGDVFPASGVHAMSAADQAIDGVIALLEDLCDREVIERRPASHYHGEREYAFRHPLVREAAYASLTEADLALGHRVAAGWFEDHGGGDSVLVAEHWLRGGQPERAVAGFLAASREALGGNDLDAVLERVERGLASGPNGAALGELLLLRAEAHRWRGDYAAAAEAAALALAALPCGGPEWYAAGTNAVTVFGCLQAYERLEELATRMLSAPVRDGAWKERIRALGKAAVQFYLIGRYERADDLCAHAERELAAAPARDENVRARVNEAMAFREGARAEQGRALELLTQAAADYEQAGDLRSAAMSRSNVGYTYMLLGDYPRAVEILERAVQDGERLGLTFLTVVAMQNLGRAAAMAGEVERGIEALREAQDQFERQGDAHMASICRIYVAEIRLLAGDPVAAEREAAAAGLHLAGNPPSLAMALALQARARVARGDDSGTALAREAYGILESLGGLDEGEMLVRLAWAEALEANERRDEARVVARVGAERLRQLAARLEDPDLRQCYLEAVAENAALLALASDVLA